MAQYIDGFAFPIPTDRLDTYKNLSESAAKIWIEHGASSYHEFVGDEMHLDGTLAFNVALSSAAYETIIFGWVAFESKDLRDEANKKVASDPRMAELMQSYDTGFDASRMAYGGFRCLH